MTVFFRVLRVVLALAAFALPAQVAIAETDRCFEDWSDAAPIMLKEGLVATKDLHDQARLHLTGSLMRITLCRAGSNYVYRLLVRDPSGRLTMVTVDARHPFEH